MRCGRMRQCTLAHVLACARLLVLHCKEKGWVQLSRHGTQANSAEAGERGPPLRVSIREDVWLYVSGQADTRPA